MEKNDFFSNNLNVKLNPWSPELDCSAKTEEGIFWFITGGSAMSNAKRFF
jgi:hypothetical protein